MAQEIFKEPAQQPVKEGSWLTYVVVVFILIFVLGLVVTPAVKMSPLNLRKSKATVMEEQVDTACRAYLTEYGQLPPTSENYRLMKILTTENPRAITFINVKPTDLTPNGDLIDPWGTPYRITFDSDAKVHVISAGSDKVFGTPDDVTNK